MAKKRSQKATKKKTVRRTKPVAKKAPAKRAGVRGVPPGMHAVVPVLTIRGAAAAIDFYKSVLGAKEIARSADPSGTIWHAALRFGDAHVYISDEMPGAGVSARPAQIWLYTADADRIFERAAAAGCRVIMPIADQFWGERMGKLVDKWDIEWSIAKHQTTLTPRQKKKAAEAFMANLANQPPA